MKKCISIVLAVLLFVNSGGFIIIYFQLLEAAKREMFVSILKGDYNAGETIQFRISREYFKVNTGGFIWKTPNEFEYKHCLYDIIKISEKDDSLILYCLNDKTEEKIEKSFHNELNELARGDINNRKVKTSLSNLVSQGLIKSAFEMAEIPGSYKYFSNRSENVLLNEREIPSPPPKLT